jgi:hypothetical protein
MRVSFSVFVLVITAEALAAADLGSPVPIPAREMRNTFETGNRKAEPAKICPCGDNCDCTTGQCPACPVPVATTYRQVWIRGTGWVWVRDAQTSTSGGCSSGTCPLPGRSR